MFNLKIHFDLYLCLSSQTTNFGNQIYCKEEKIALMIGSGFLRFLLSMLAIPFYDEDETGLIIGIDLGTTYSWYVNI